MRLINTTRVALLLSAFGLGAACAAGNSTSPGGATGTGGSATTGTHTGAGGATGTGTGGSTGVGISGSSGAGGSLFEAGLGDAPINADSGCGLITVNAQPTPLDLYIALDQSSAMSADKWLAATSGITAFLNDPASAGIRVAINFFPLPQNPTCNQMAYETPIVPFGALPQNAMAIQNAMNAAMPDGFYETIYPALGGALLACIAEATNNPGDSAAVLLVTDGEPNGPPAATCGGVDPSDPASVAKIAASGLAYSPSIKTFVIGLPGVNQTTANQIAAAGGTGSAVLVSANSVQTEFEKALAQVRGQALPCTYDLPSQVAGGQIDPTDVNVLVTTGGGMPTVLPQDPTCKSSGWNYDDPVHPKHIFLCASTCSSLKAMGSVTVQIVLGCPTQVAK